MNTERFMIKNMVCDRCILVVEQVFATLEIPVKHVVLGEVLSAGFVSEMKKKQLAERLQQLGFDILEDKKQQLVERVKTIIIDIVHHKQLLPHTNLSDYISEQLKSDYNTISKLFSVHEKTTVEKFIIAQKIERVKELLSYNELTLSEIADRMHYSSVAHLSTQFKKITGMTPSEYKNNSDKQRLPLHDV